MTGMFAVERFIEGQYLKHNNNSGYIEDDHHRMTPQAFSHFTHTASSGGEMVVDVQGVGDLWTDPQIHSDKLRYGQARAWDIHGLSWSGLQTRTRIPTLILTLTLVLVLGTAQATWATVAWLSSSPRTSAMASANTWAWSHSHWRPPSV